MRLGTLVIWGMGVFSGQLLAQDCPAVARIWPSGTVTGAADASNCVLSDGTVYVPYRLDLTVRGQIRIDLSSDSAGYGLFLRDSSGVQVDSGVKIARPIEAGSYTVLLNATQASGATYRVTTSFAAEPGMLCSNFPNIGRRETVRGALPGSGCVAPDGTPFEAYTLTTDGSGTLTVTVDSSDFSPVISVRSIDGRVVGAPVAGPLNVVLGGDSQYLVVIASAEKKGGAYQITTAYQTAGNETCRSRKTLAESDTDTNSIAADSCFVTIAGSGDQAYYNYYNVTLTAPGVVSAMAVSGDFTATLNLLDSAGNLMASNSGGGGYDAQANVQSSLRAQLPAGSYRLQLFSDVPSGGAYTLNYSFTPGNPKPCAAAALAFGTPLMTGLNAGSCRTSLGMADLYTITLPSPGTLDLNMSASMFDTLLAIRDAKDNLIVRNDDVDGVTVSHVSADLPAGTYTVVAAATSGAGVYELAANFTAHDIPACTFAQTIDLNGGYIQRLGQRSCRAANGQPVDYYTFTLAVDSLVLAVMTSSEVDGYLTLYDSAGNVMRTDDNSYGSADPLIVQYLPAGTYKVGARDASGSAGGLYEVDLRTTAGPRPPFCTARATIAQGTSMSGVITYTGCQYSDATFADFYQITLSADATIDIHADSSEFDAYLVLLDAKGADLDEDDDSGGNTNARLTETLPAGTYTIVVKPFGDYTSHGKYTLSVK